MSKYNKAFVAIAMAFVYYANAKYGITIPLSETDANLLIGLITSALVWAVPNK